MACDWSFVEIAVIFLCFLGRADMYPKMTWGTPLPPQTPFTYPPYKRIGHMAVMGSTMSIDTKPMMISSEMSPRYPKYENDSIITSSRSLNLEPAKQSRFMVSTGYLHDRN